MAVEVADQRSLNPEAPEFVPSNQNMGVLLSSHISTSTRCYFSSDSSSLNPSFQYYQQSPAVAGAGAGAGAPYISTYSPLLFSQSLYINPYPNHFMEVQQLAEVLPAAESESVVPPLDETQVMHETKVAQKGGGGGAKVQKKKGSSTGGKEGFRGHGSQGAKHEWRVKCGSHEGKYSYRKVGDVTKSTRRNVKSCRPVRKLQQRYAVVPVQSDGHGTTVMIRNIPNKYTREMLIEFLDNHCKLENQKAKPHSSSDETFISAFDFLYLPIDFQSGLNKGYAFVNFTDPRAVWIFHLASHNQPWEHFNSKKKLQVASARLQGKDELVKHFKGMEFPCEQFLPLCFSPARDGLSTESVRQTTVGKCTATSS